MIHLLGTELSGQAPRQTTEGHCFERDEDGLRGLAPDSDLQHRTQRPPGDACCGPAGVEKQLGTSSNSQAKPERRACQLLHPAVSWRCKWSPECVPG